MSKSKFFKSIYTVSIAAFLLSGNLSSFCQTAGIVPKAPVSIKTYIPADKAISPMPVQERIRRGVVPERGLVSTVPGVGKNDMLLSGNGKTQVEVYGNPTSELVIFRNEHMQLPWPVGFEAPKIGNILPQVKRLMLEGKYKEGLDLSIKASRDVGFPPGTMNHDPFDAFRMKIELQADGKIENYLRTVDFESGEVKVLWSDKRGDWERKTFVSRPDNVVVQLLTAPKNQLLNTKIDIVTQSPWRQWAPANQNGANSPIRIERDLNNQRFIVKGHFVEPNTGNKGYTGVVRIVLDGGSANIENDVLVIKDAKSVMLLSRVEHFEDFQDSKVNDVVQSLEKISPDYQALLARNKKVQAEIFDRASLDFITTKEEKALSSEELLADQKTHIGYNLNLISKLFDVGRYWQMISSGEFPPILGHLNINVNLQVAGGNQANLPEAMDAFYHWIEGVIPDSKKNAANMFGTRGMVVATHPDRETGVLYHFDGGWPHHYWISAGGWAYSPFWDRYLVTGDKEFLRDHVMPGLRELALFYEDFLTETDKDGNFIFVPSYSPENWPGNINEGAVGHPNIPTVLNATMDIMVCREVLTHLIEGAEILGTDSGDIPRWEELLTKMPPYLLDEEGALKEWAWPTLDEFQDHRHISHMYGVWPADEIDPDRTPELAKASWLANRKRAQGNGSGHGISHRLLAAARLKDDYIVNFELKQLIEQGYFSQTLMAYHNPYSQPFGDQQGSVLTVLMEMLLYSREGVVELLPALPETLDHGSIKGILSRSFARIDDLTWDMNARTADLTITSLRNQDITLIVRHGIESIVAPEGVLKSQPKTGTKSCVLHLQQNKPVKIQVKLGQHKPSDWILSLDKKN